MLERESSRPRRRGAYCATCLAERRRELGELVREVGAAASKPGPETQPAVRSQLRTAAEEQSWELEHEGEVPDREWYLREVLPGLAGVTTTASQIRAGKQVPHPRWWRILSRLSH